MCSLPCARQVALFVSILDRLLVHAIDYDYVTLRFGFIQLQPELLFKRCKQIGSSCGFASLG